MRSCCRFTTCSAQAVPDTELNPKDSIHRSPETGEFMSLSSVGIGMFIIRPFWKCCALCQVPHTLSLTAWGPYETGNWKPLVGGLFGRNWRRWMIECGMDIWLSGGGISPPLPPPTKDFKERRRGESKTDTEMIEAKEVSEAGCFRIQSHSSRSVHYRNNLKQHIPLSRLSHNNHMVCQCL